MIEITNMKRPLSPHLSIYKPQVTSVFSILHRVTGVYIFVFFVLVAFTLFVTTVNDNFLTLKTLEETHSVKYTLILSIITFITCLSYHTCTGIRYLFWSCGIGVNISSAKITAGAITILTIIMSLISTYMFLSYN
jgi:succinate dehydrogenase / fumarate reductase cytochrome b subunit